MLNGIALYGKIDGKEVPILELDIYEATRRAGINTESLDEVIVTAGDVSHAIQTNATLRLIVGGVSAGTAIGGAERTGEDAVEQTFFAAVPEPE